MADQVSRITIVGGGTTGWLAALYLATKFKASIETGSMCVEVIESDRIPIVGVGESLSPSMPVSLSNLGVEEAAFIRETDASFKVAGYFLNWEKQSGDAPASWVNPFVAFTGMGLEFERFAVADDRTADYGTILSPCREAIRRRLGPKRIDQPSYHSILRYAYHTDASKFAPFLHRLAASRGVTRIVDDVLGAVVDERGHVESLQLQALGSHPVEFVIDATGFSGVILNQTLKMEMLDYGRHLINDRAVVLPTDYPHPETDIEPATRSTALSAGWAFQVPLYSRMGNGYIYSSAHISDDAATEEFVTHLGPGARAGDCRVIRMRIGRARRSWVGNCVALGLAAGFVEPLESSAIYSVETSLKWLYNYFPDRDFDPALANRYNDRVATMFDEVVDYVALHYALADRDDSSYWIAQRHDIELPARLRENLAVWKNTLPARGDFPAVTYFDENTYLAALFGKGFYPGGSLHPERELSRKDWERSRRDFDATTRQAISALPNHRALLTAIRG